MGQLGHQRHSPPWHTGFLTHQPALNDLQADLGDLRGLTTGLDGRNSSMINGGEFDGAKAYKDSKVSSVAGQQVGCQCAALAAAAKRTAGSTEPLKTRTCRP